MKAEVQHRFSASHQHMTPEGMCTPHVHRWVLTVRVGGPLHPEYGWVADFRVLRRMLADVAPHRPWWRRLLRSPADYTGTAEQILVELMKELAYRLGPTGPIVVWARLEEKPGQAAVYEPARETIDLGGVVR